MIWSMADAPKVEKSEAEWRSELSPEAYHVLREAGTERAWSGEYVDWHGDGTSRIPFAAYTDEDLHREGVAGIWIGVESSNEPSIRAISKAGFEHAYSFISEVEGSSVIVRADRQIDEGESLHIVSKPSQDDPSGA